MNRLLGTLSSEGSASRLIWLSRRAPCFPGRGDIDAISDVKPEPMRKHQEDQSHARACRLKLPKANKTRLEICIEQIGKFIAISTELADRRAMIATIDSSPHWQSRLGQCETPFHPHYCDHRTAQPVSAATASAKLPRWYHSLYPAENEGWTRTRTEPR